MPETDSVLTTVEVQQLLEERGCKLAELPEEPLDSLVGGPHQNLATWTGGSGEHFQTACSQESLLAVP